MRKLSELSPSIFLTIAISVSSTAQVSSKTAGMSSNAAEHAAALAESGGCSEALPSLAKAAPHLTDKELQKRVALDGVRCATLLKQAHGSIKQLSITYGALLHRFTPACGQLTLRQSS